MLELDDSGNCKYVVLRKDLALLGLLVLRRAKRGAFSTKHESKSGLVVVASHSSVTSSLASLAHLVNTRNICDKGSEHCLCNLLHVLLGQRRLNVVEVERVAALLELVKLCRAKRGAIFFWSRGETSEPKNKC